MIRRSDITVFADGVTPEPGVYVTVKDDTGALATLYDDAAALKANPFTSAGDGTFSYNIANADAGVFTEEYRLSLSDSPRTIRVVSLGGITNVNITIVTPQQFGAVGDNVTNDGAAFTSAIAYLNSIALSGFGYGMGTPKLFIPAGHYYLGTTTLDITHTMIIEGENATDAGGASTVLRWAGATGIRTQAHNTTGASGTQAPAAYRGDGSIIRNLFLSGDYSGTDAEYHGIHLRAKATIRDCYISGFRGDGVYANATAGSGGATEGNVNCFELSRLIIQGCRNGVYLVGADVNAGAGHLLDVMSNRAWGIQDNSFLGNTWTACHTSGNLSGPYRSQNNNARCVFVGCYSESDQPTSSFVYPTMIVGGLHAAGVAGTGVYLRSYFASLQVAGVIAGDPAGIYAALNDDGSITATGQILGTLGLHVTGGLPSFGGAGGVEVFHLAGACTVNAYNRAGAVFLPLSIDALTIALQASGATIGTIIAAGLNLAAGKVLQVNGTQVVGAQGAAVADAAALTSVNATNAAGVPTQAEFNAFVAEFNKLRTDVGAVRTTLNTDLARERAHGLIAP